MAQPIYGKPATSKSIAANTPRLTIEVEKGQAGHTAAAGNAPQSGGNAAASTGAAGSAATGAYGAATAASGNAQPAGAPASTSHSPAPGAAPQPATRSATAAPTTKLTGLAAMREALAAKQQHENAAAAAAASASVPLTAGALAVYWEEFIDRFRQANKMTVVGNLQLAQVLLLGPEEIGLVSRNIVQYRFMEEEKLEISDFFKKKFRNKDLVLTLSLDESQQEVADTGPAPLSSREQYARMVEKYPLVKELKDRLNMELDF